MACDAPHDLGGCDRREEAACAITLIYEEISGTVLGRALVLTLLFVTVIRIGIFAILSVVVDRRDFFGSHLNINNAFLLLILRRYLLHIHDLQVLFGFGIFCRFWFSLNFFIAGTST